MADMTCKTKPRVYSDALVRKLVARMREGKVSMAQACASRIDLPSYDVARGWLVTEPYFRSIYPYPGRTFMGKRTEADIAGVRKLLQDTWRKAQRDDLKRMELLS